jgi:pimeloyl-ACP methyl ester carboxylesterase
MGSTAPPLEWCEVDVDGRPAAYGVGGSGPPLVFLHGWGLSGRTYRASLQRLMHAGVRVWAPSLPPRESGGLDTYADWVDAFCAAVGIDEPAVFVGHSFGGAVAIRSAHREPARVRGLVLVNSIGGAQAQALWDWGWRAHRELFPLRDATRILPLVLNDAIPNVLRNPRAAWHAVDAARSADLGVELAGLEAHGVPIVVVWSHDDALITRASFESLYAALTAPVVRTVPGNHAWLIADPAGFGEVMTNVLSLIPDALPRGA